MYTGLYRPGAASTRSPTLSSAIVLVAPPSSSTVADAGKHELFFGSAGSAGGVSGDGDGGEGAGDGDGDGDTNKDKDCKLIIANLLKQNSELLDIIRRQQSTIDALLGRNEMKIVM